MRNEIFKFGQGDQVKDTITGFHGIVVCRTEWLNGCIRYGLQSQALDKDALPAKIEMIDEGQLELVEASKCAIPMMGTNPPGGPRDDETSPVAEISDR